MNDFQQEVKERIASYADNKALQKKAHDFVVESVIAKYSYNFSWAGRPIIQYPTDIVALQEIIWQVQPDLIIETGIAHGGSLIFSASMLAMLDVCDAATNKTAVQLPSKRQVLGLDIDIRAHNRAAIEQHPLFSYITMIEGSSIEEKIIQSVRDVASKHQRILLCLDSNHTHDHVLAELKAYASLVSVGSYCVVFDTVIEDMPSDFYPDRPWTVGNNPKTAVREFLRDHPEFVNEESIVDKVQISMAPSGFLRRVA